MPVNEHVAGWGSVELVGAAPGDHEGGEFFDGDGVAVPAGRNGMGFAAQVVADGEPVDPVAQFPEQDPRLRGAQGAPGPWSFFGGGADAAVEGVEGAFEGVLAGGERVEDLGDQDRVQRLDRQLRWVGTTGAGEQVPILSHREPRRRWERG